VCPSLCFRKHTQNNIPVLGFAALGASRSLGRFEGLSSIVAGVLILVMDEHGLANHMVPLVLSLIFAAVTIRSKQIFHVW
jgi:hypothetical protein